jgi:23S rRNA (cytidine1920-2'-O)/16S rRNA (cytidine1409-2'-O)-methyltransferase
MVAKRIDLLLVERGLFPSREQARRAILEGRVSADGRTCRKPGESHPADRKFEVVPAGREFVGRGGIKLDRALDAFGIDVRGLVCADIGASTGGFTDCLLQRGAAKVYAVDAGRGQLDPKLREDPRVVVREKLNFRFVRPEEWPEPVDFACCDVSFISLRLILPPLFGILKSPSQAVCLVKPQFEAGRGHLSGNGVVRDPKARAAALEMVAAYARDAGFRPEGSIESPVRGKDGNVEFLLRLVKP